MKPTWGVPVEEIQRGIKNGVRKINIDTDNRMAMTGQIRKVFAENPVRVRSAQVSQAGAGGDDQAVQAAAAGVQHRRPGLEDQAVADAGRHGQALCQGRARSEILGAGSLKSRDDAMSAGEDGVDYLMFGEPTADGYVPPLAETVERLDWWSQIFEVPCIGYAAKLDDVAALCAAGADFVALGDAVWSHARGPAAAVAQAESLLKARPAS
jgi:hypothetical protein